MFGSQWFANPSTGYTINNSCVFDASSSAYMSKASTTPTLDTKFTFSTWLKRGNIDATSSSDHFGIFGHRQDADAANKNVQLAFFDDMLYCAFIDGGSVSFMKYSTALYRDVAAWYHIVFAVDSTDGTAADRVKLYVNGTRITAFTGDNINPAEDETFLSTSCTIDVGRFTATDGTSHFYFDGYMADVYYIDGTAYAESDFGETNDEGVWIPKSASGLTFGNNGFYLNFKDSSNLGNDANGGTDLSETNLAATDQATDTPTNNFCVLNPLAPVNGGAPSTLPTFSEGNRQITVGDTTARFAVGTIATKIAYYFEVKVTAISASDTAQRLGIVNSRANSSTTSFYSQYEADGTIISSGETDDTGNDTITVNDIIGVAVDLGTNNNVKFYENGDLQATMSVGASYQDLASTPFARLVNATTTFQFNFGNPPFTISSGNSDANGYGNFEYAVPSGYLALCTKNLSEPSIKDPSVYFQAQLYAGNGTAIGSGGKAVTLGGNSDMQPDFVWIKNRSAADDHSLFDSARGVTKELELPTAADQTTQSEGLTAFGSDGFTVGNRDQVNTSSENFVSWNWKESATAGFDIVTYTGTGVARTVSHNLGAVPEVMIVKETGVTGDTADWWVYNDQVAADPATDFLRFNTTAAVSDTDEMWNDTAPTSSVFTVGVEIGINGENDTYVAYLFRAIDGYSNFHYYKGNSDADGPFLYTGFKPAFFISKAINGVSDWIIWDNKRGTYNPNSARLTTQSGAEGSANLDFLSNGIKIRNDDSSRNETGVAYLVMVFAENPFGGDGVAPATAV
jgi:hypothetical protein